jgi:hypothetical protein
VTRLDYEEPRITFAGGTIHDAQNRKRK